MCILYMSIGRRPSNLIFRLQNCFFYERTLRHQNTIAEQNDENCFTLYLFCRGVKIGLIF